jgi:hypothetical protein
VKILKNRVFEADYARTVYVVKPENGTTLADMVKPEYWAHVASYIKKPGSRIEVFTEDGTWWAELYVRSVKEQAINVYVLRSVVFDQDEQKPEVVDGKYTVKWSGPVAMWRVIRSSDNAVVAEGLEKDQAIKWVEDQKVAA